MTTYDIAPRADRCVHEAVALQAVRLPEAVALLSGSRRVGYAELDRRANQLANHLVHCGVRPGDVVGVCLPRDVPLVVAVLAVLKAGAAYTMLDPRFPAHRRISVCEWAGVRHVVTDTPDMASAGSRWTVIDPVAGATRIGTRPATAPEVPVFAADTACVMFTSGSTGRPKGVLAPHRAFTGTLLEQEFVSFSPDQVWLQCSPVSWDAFALELFGALLHGATCVLQPGETPEPAVVARLIAEHGITTVHLSASLLNFMLDEHPGAFGGVRQIMTGGEPASVSHVTELLRRYPEVRLVNGYSPVENMIFTLCHDITEADIALPAIPVGRPIAGKKARVLGPDLRPVPVGTPGEIYMSGVGLSHGYLGEPGLTAARFVPDPDDGSGGRMYRTGDIGCLRADGVLEFHGRADDQIKIRGFRIEPTEIQTALTTHPHVTRAAVVVWEPRPGDRRLAAYAVTTVPTGTEALRAHVAEILPEHLVPAVVVELDALPLTPTGKLDRAALPDPASVAVVGAGGAPTTETETVLCDLFASVLGVPSVGVEDDFLALGGHSLLVATLVSRIRATLGVEVRIGEVFAARTPRALAGVTAGASRARPIPAVTARPELMPLSSAQVRLWFQDEVQSAATYVIPLLVRLRGPLDGDALHAATDDVVRRHEALRTAFPLVEGTPVQRVLAGASVPWSSQEVAGQDPDDLVRELASTPFNLAEDIPVRAHLLRRDRNDHTLVLALHHIACDGWSITPLLQDLATAYRARRCGRVPDWPALPVQYADYTLWERHALGEADDPYSRRAQQSRYWREVLAGLPDEVTLPGDRGRPAVRSSRGDVVPVVLDAGLHRSLHELARRTGSTVFMVLHAALAALLARLGAGTDIPIGTPVAGRGDEALEGLVGFFANTLVLRTDTSGDPTFTQLLARVRAADLAAFDHQDVPFDRIVEELNPARTLSRHPLFQVMLVLQNTPATSAGFVDLQAEHRVGGLGIAKFDLTVDLTETTAGGVPDGIVGHVEYATDLYDRDTVERTVARLIRLLAAGALDPDVPIGAVDLLDRDERQRLLAQASGTARPRPDLPVHEAVAGYATRTPEAVAVVAGTNRVTYAELDARANRFAHHLIARGVRPGRFVGVLLDRDIDMVVAVLGVLKAGAAFLMLDPRFPAHHTAALVEQARPPLVVTGPSLVSRLADIPVPALVVRDDPAAAAPGHPPKVRITPDDVACVMFTSGSTGRPKGVLAPHRALTGTLLRQEFVRFGRDEVWLQCAPLPWDAFALELFGPLLSGATCVLQPGPTPEPGHIAALVATHGVTTLHLSATLLNFMIDEFPEAFRGVRQIMTGGEPASVAHVAELLARHPEVRLINGYSPVENMIFTLCHRVTEDDTVLPAIPIGRPIANKQCYVLDERLGLLPTGVTGELYMAGVGLAQGYLGAAGATAERFVACPYGAPGERMYRTGDLCRRRTDGVLEYIGRSDDQVKIRGFRVEPVQVQTAFTGHPLVRQAAVVVREDRPGDKRLVAYIVAAPGVDVAALREHGAKHLPEHLRPSAFVLLDALPANANGKLDRAALPAPDLPGTPAGRVPRTPQEEIVRGLFAEVLGVGDADDVGIDDDFFALGGHSLLAAALAGRVGAALGVRVTVREVFDHPTPAGLAQRAGRLGPSSRQRVSAAAERPARLPLSYAQQRLWFGHRMRPGMTYNVPVVLRLTGRLDEAVLRAALTDVVRRHEPLRTVYTEVDGTPYQEIHDDAEPPFETVGSADVAAAVRNCNRHVFDLATELPIRCTLLRLGRDEHVLVMIFHHIATDGWSEVPLLRDLATAYAARREGGAPDWRPLAVQYADYTLWQRKLLAGEADGLAAYWREALRDAPICLHLPIDRPRPPVAGTVGAGEPILIEPALHDALLHVARANRVTLFMVLQAAWATLLTRLGAGTDIPIGVPVAGRPHESLSDLVGFFVNTLVLRTDTSGNPAFEELLARIRGVDLDGYQHEELPFEQVVQAVNPHRTPAAHPLFQTMLILQNTGEAEMSLPGLTVRREPFTTGVAKFDLVVDVGPAHPGGLRGSLDYRTDLFDRSTARSLVAGFLGVLGEIAADPSAPIDPAPTVLDLFTKQVQARPDAVAVVSPGRELSYRELDERANAVAWELRDSGVGRGTAVGVGVQRSADMVVAMLAVFKAGGVYVPLDPDYPAPRLRLMVEDAAPPVIVTNRHLTDRLPGGPRLLLIEEHNGTRQDPPPGPRPGNLAYVIYTSGSSGRPKGVAVGHAALGLHTRAMVRVFGYTAADRTLVFASIAFDMSVEQIVTPLACGAAAVVRPDGMLGTGDLVRYADHHAVTVVNLPPAYLEALLREGAQLDSVRLFVSGGDTVTPGIVRAARDALGRRRVLNAYGPTETTITATVQDLAEVAEDGPVPIGRPVPGARVRVLNGTGAPAGPGEIGEIVIGGDGVARGYLNQPTLTAQRFVEDEAGHRFYRTGDLGRYLPGGALEFLGRADDQAKINGFRIEPAEVGAALAKLPGVTAAVVIVNRDEAGGGRLLGYATTATGAGDGLSLRRGLLEVLPRHMVPAAVTVLDAFPLTPNGKVDRKALVTTPAVAPLGDGPEGAGAVSSDPGTDLLAGIWAEVLGVSRVEPHDNFFALGGHSMLAIQLLSRVNAAFDADVPLHWIFEEPTLADMAALVGGRTRTAARSTPAASAGRDRGPLSSGQERLWLLQTLDPDSHDYNVASLWQLDGAVDVRALGDALTDLVRRHRILRTRFDIDDDGPYQKVVPAAPIPLDIHSATFDRGQIPPEARTFAEEPFDLTTPPLLRARLFRDARRPDEFLFLLVCHHITTDGAALSMMLRELGAAYRRQPVAEPKLQYLDYAVWERQQSPAEEHVAYWRDRLHDLRPMEWPAIGDRPANRSGGAATLTFDVPRDVVAGLRELGRTSDMSMFVMTLAAVQATLAEFTGRHDIAVGVPLTMRAESGLADVVGFLTDTLVVRSRIGAAPDLRAVLDSVRASVLDGMAHAMPFDRVVEELNPEREVGRNPLFQVFFAHERTDGADTWSLPEVTTTPMPWQVRTAKFDLDVDCTESADSMTFTLMYETGLLDATGTRRLADRLAATLSSVANLTRQAAPRLPLGLPPVPHRCP